MDTQARFCSVPFAIPAVAANEGVAGLQRSPVGDFRRICAALCASMASSLGLCPAGSRRTNPETVCACTSWTARGRVRCLGRRFGRLGTTNGE